MLFQESFSKEIHDVICTCCNRTKASVEELYIFPDECKFVILRIVLTIFTKNKITRFATKITNFDPNNIIISNQTFQLIAAVVKNEISENSGHYVCYVRSKNTWMLISDDKCELFDEFVHDLENVYFILLQRL